MTTAPAPTLEFRPTVIGPSTLAPAAITTLSSIVGCLFPFSLPVPPSVTPWKIVTLLAYLRGLAYHHPHTVVDEKPLAYRRALVYLDPGDQSREHGKEAREQRDTLPWR